MAGQVGKLTLEAVIKGFEDVQGLGKALNLVDKLQPLIQNELDKNGTV